jgi:hypothetical protein
VAGADIGYAVPRNQPANSAVSVRGSAEPHPVWGQGRFGRVFVVHMVNNSTVAEASDDSCSLAPNGAHTYW